MISTILIIGGGQAGAQAIDTLRREGFSGRLVLIGDEPQLPYQRPPLSKKYLSGEMAADRLSFRHQTFYDEHRIELKLGRRAVRLDAATRQVELVDGEIVAYDRLLLCLGAESRQLTCPGADLPGVHYLRSLADVAPIQAGFKPQARVVIIGGGYIGLETAATSRKMGCEVTVLEMADRIMNRVVAPCVSGYFADEHRAHGVNILCDMRVVRLEGTGRVERVVCADGSSHAADLVIVGVGAVATTELASKAGLRCDNGIVVDEYCRTSDAAIFAAGDCTNHPSLRFGRRVRLESVDNAFEQAKTAAFNLLDRPVAHDRVPWFWSDQFDNKLLIVGLSQDYDRQVLRGDPAARSFSVCYLKGGELLAVEAINHSKDYMAARKLIAERALLNPEKLADPELPLKEAI
jgi:3-phenylpropionate/trans-cinnamate dioxygenase ferredoxin reductase component